MSVHQSTGGLRTPGRRVAFCLLSAALGLGGCAQSPARTLTRVWDDVPKPRWLSSPETERDDHSTDTKLAGKSRARDSRGEGLAEKNPIGRLKLPSRSAESKPDAETDDRSLLASRKQGSPHDPFLEDELLSAKKQIKRPAVAKKTESAESPQLISHRDRLKAALSDDSRRSQKPDEQAADQDRLRLRVEALMGRAKDHLKRNELAAAQRAVELAQNLTENGQLEFAPDEERPIEVLTTIIARREAEAAAEALATSESEPEAEGSSDIKPTASTQSRRDSDFRLDDNAFDPYDDRVVSARLPDDPDSVFGTSMVVLESPSFETDDESSAVNPTAYTRDEERAPHAARTALRAIPHERDDEDEEIPAPPLSDEPSPDVVELPEASDAEESIAPLPPIDLPQQGPRLGSISLAEIEADQTEDGSDAELKPAGSWPRWMPLSVLSLLTTGFCVWLWRRRVNAAA